MGPMPYVGSGIITLPLLKPTAQFVLVMATIWNLQLFDSVFVLTDGGPVNRTITVVMYVYRSLFAFGNVGFGYAPLGGAAHSDPWSVTCPVPPSTVAMSMIRVKLLEVRL